MAKDRYNRQVLFFGEEGQHKISSTRVGIVGLGGLGSHIAQGLAYLGIMEYVLVDDDRVEDTNLNRLVGATPYDTKANSHKVYVAERMIHSIKPDANITTIIKSLRSQEAIDSLITCPVIFGCVDHDAPRLILMELASAYESTLIDCATEIDKDRGTYGGRVIVAQPGDFCLDCAGQIDMEVAKEELKSPELRELSKKHGYGLGEEAIAPSVISINGVIAYLAITEFMCMITGLRKPNRHLTYYGERGIANKRDDGRKAGCYTCEYLKGRGEAANIKRYVLL